MVDKLKQIVLSLFVVMFVSGAVFAQEATMTKIKQPDPIVKTATESAPTIADGLGEKLGDKLADQIPKDFDFLRKPGNLVSTLQLMLVMTVLTLAPSIMIMTTSFVRIMTVLSILRQAIGTNQLPPNQVITALSLFLTLLIMMPVGSAVYTDSIKPFSEEKIDAKTAWERGETPIRQFMVKQIIRCGNTDDILVFLPYIKDYKVPEKMTWRDVPWRALLPAYMMSELKTAFYIGFMVYLPFLVLDMVVASVMVSMGMMMLPPTIVSLPFKLMLFVLVNGWQLVVVMLLESFDPYVPGEVVRHGVSVISGYV